MTTNASEISKVIKSQIESYTMASSFQEAGTVVSVGDGIANVYGLDSCMNGELLEFADGTQGMALNLEEDVIGVIVMGSDLGIKEGDPVRLTGRMAEVPVGDAMIGRVVNPLGEPIDAKGPINNDGFRPIEAEAPSVIDRSEVNESLETGTKAVDALVPIGKGQRELIIGDRETGKTAIAIDAIINQKGKDVKCVYVAIGQKSSTVARIINVLEDQGAMDYTSVVFSSAAESSSMQYFAPYAGCAIAEYWMNKGEDVLIVYDDLSKHAVAYRAISLLLGRPPGREAYPGDVFYLHSRLLERAGNLNEGMGGGSMTALPIVETQEGDISAYIPTNVISITDGQIYLESDLFNNGIMPAINPGLSVSRVGGSAQHPAMKKIAGPVRIEYAQYNELAAFSQFGTDLNEDTQRRLNHGEKITEVLKQRQYRPMDVEEQIVVFYALVEGFIDDIRTSKVRAFQADLLRVLDQDHRDLMDSIKNGDELSEENQKKLDQIIKDIKENHDYS